MCQRRFKWWPDPPTAPSDPNDPTVNFVEWPLPDAFAALSVTGIEGWRCGSYEGDAATSLLETFGRANQSTIFTEDDANYRL